ncbi:MAG TPA: cell division protein FtsB [Burkholderiales bacterium]|jgi:cell division protein FtsB
MKILAIVLGVLILLIQYPLWLGKGGWLKVWDADRQVAAQKQVNDDMQSRNDGLAAEVTDLKQGMEAVEERARYDLGFVKKDEIFFQIVDPPKADTTPAR